MQQERDDIESETRREETERISNENLVQRMAEHLGFTFHGESRYWTTTVPEKL